MFVVASTAHPQLKKEGPGSDKLSSTSPALVSYHLCDLRSRQDLNQQGQQNASTISLVNMGTQALQISHQFWAQSMSDARGEHLTLLYDEILILANTKLKMF